MREDRSDVPRPDANESRSEEGRDVRLPYEPPRLLKKREVARVTLFSGGSGSVVST